MTNEFTQAKCPMQGCTEDLYIAYAGMRPVYLDDTAADLADPRESYTTSWQIECVAGHVVLLPIDHAGDTHEFGWEHDTSESGDPDEACVHDDLGRLHRLIGVTAPAGESA